MLEFFDYELLRIIWWLMLGSILIIFAVTDGFDLGVAILSPFIAKNESEKRVMLNSVGPVWKGNQIWLIIGIAVSFSVWPYLYAISFSGFYFVIFLLLLALSLRPFGFEYRGKLDNKTWRQFWDICMFIAGVLAAFIFGVAMGNVLQGVPFDLDEFMVIENQIIFYKLFNPFASLCGLVSLAMLITHGACYLGVKTEGRILGRAKNVLKIWPVLTIILFALGGIFLNWVESYKLIKFAGVMAESNPLRKEVVSITGGWYGNYYKYPWMLIAPALGFLGELLVLLFAWGEKFKAALIASDLAIFGIISTVGLAMFPFILPSSLNPNVSLIIWDSSSSHHTMFLMLCASMILVPTILFSAMWVYKVFGGKVTEENVEKNTKILY